MPPVYAGVVRVSHMGKRTAGAANVHTDRDQVAAIKSVVPTGADLEILPYELDVSGGLRLDQRPSLNQAVRGIEQGRYAGLIVAYHSRLFRNVEEEEAVWRRVEAVGGQVLLALDPVDNKTVDGRMLRRIKAAQHTAERERHAERFEDLRRNATAAGIWQRRQTPLGYRRDDATRKLVPDENAGKVLQAFAARAGSMALVSIARTLGMTPSGVRALLRNRVYLGELKVGRHVNPAAHEPLVTLEQFEGAQRTVSRPARGARAPALLAGLVRCAGCGHVMTRTASGKVPVYACPRNHSGGACPAPASVTIGLLDAVVDPVAIAELEQLRIQASGRDRVAPAKERLARAEAELEAYVTATSAVDIGATAFAAGARTRKEAVDDARHALQAELGRQRLAPTWPSAKAAYDELDATERNHLLRSLLSAVIVRRAGGRGARVTLTDRTRILAFGHPTQFPRASGGRPAGIVPIPLPDVDDEGVLRVLPGEDGL